jgi:signal transduction histidine kinase
MPETLALEEPGWTGLRLGLLFAWASALVALVAVAIGAGSLLTFSQKRLRFVSAVTHELRSPLTTLRLYLDLLIGGLIREESQRENYIRTLHAETDRLSCLVNNVLEFARLENQGAPQLQHSLDLSGWLSSIAQAWQIRLEVAGKQLVIQAEPGLQIWGSSVLLGQIIGNLLDNACKYTRDAADARVWLRAWREKDVLIVEVEDRGPGIAPRDERLVFRTFERGHAVETSTGGVGLGLSLARRWARAMSGTLNLRRSAEGGACFRLEIPQPPLIEPERPSLRG